MHDRIAAVDRLSQGAPQGRAIVVIPTYNERDNIRNLLPAFAALGAGVDLLIADDGSPDGTAAIVAAEAASLPYRVFLMRRTGKFGLGVCYLDAFQWIRAHLPEYTRIIQMDADFSHDPHMIPLLLERASAYGVAVGSRYVQGGSTPDWDHRRVLLSKGGNLYARIVLCLFHPSYPVRDSTSGFIAWRTDVLDGVLALGVFGDGYAFATSLKFVAFRIDYPPAEVPIVFRDRRLGVSKLDRRIILEAIVMPWRLGWVYRGHPNTPPSFSR